MRVLLISLISIFALTPAFPGASAVYHCESLPIGLVVGDCVGIDEWWCTGAAVRDNMGGGWARIYCTGELSAWGYGPGGYGRHLCTGESIIEIYTPLWKHGDMKCVGYGHIYDGSAYRGCAGYGVSEWHGGTTWTSSCDGVPHGF